MSRQSTGKFLDVVRAYWSRHQKVMEHNFSRYAQRCQVVAAEQDRVKLEFTVTNDVLNTVGTLHGGCTATLLDICMSLSHFAANEITGNDFGGTIDMTIHYMNAAKLGDILEIDVETIKTEDTLGFFKGEISRKNDGAIIATATQTCSFKSRL
uniref:Thioesterase domain-containing protein n=1 Tax=Panagrolaimus sp. JU765 TaxID=591449 RepID=A0AC34QW81_9BILA